jgi:hypothetical protein
MGIQFRGRRTDLISSRCNTLRHANHDLMVELAYTQDLKSCVRKDLRVRVPLRPLPYGLKIPRGPRAGSIPALGIKTYKELR